MNPETYEFTVDEASHGSRLDAFLSERLAGVSRSRIARQAQTILLNGVPQKPSRKVKTGDRVECSLRPSEPHDLQPEPVEFSVVFENEAVIVVDKPAGLVVHPAAGNWSGTLVHGLLHRYQTISASFETNYRPGIVHRLDKDTSGLIIIAKDPESHAFLQRQFARRTVRKKYVAIVSPRTPQASGVIRGYIVRDPSNRKRFTYDDSRGKPAETTYRLVAAFGAYSLVELFPRTGRTHQLRVHMRHIQSPIVGDTLYSRTRGHEGLMLHAVALQVRLPGAKDPTVFTSPIPERFSRFLREHDAPPDVAAMDWSEVPPEWLSEDHRQEKST
ncbi:MAG: RluA family pseudouridine synthase [Spirochaetota bacterium]